jgi:hypothetical protein
MFISHPLTAKKMNYRRYTVYYLTEFDSSCTVQVSKYQNLRNRIQSWTLTWIRYILNGCTAGSR